MKLGFLKGAFAVAVASLAIGGAGAAAAQDAAEFYKGNAIRWIVPYNPGGGYDEYTRLIAPYFEKYSGARVDIVNMPGAGGMKGANEIFNSPPDGLTIGVINGSAMVTNQLSEIEGAQYKIADYSYLGRMVADLRVIVVGTQSKFNTFEDMIASDSPIIVGATGLGGSTYVDAVITGPIFGIDQKIVHGFDNSSDVRQAILRGDVQAMWGSLGSALQGVEDGDQRIVVQSDRVRSPLLPEVPSIFEFAEQLPNKDEIMPILDAWDALNAVGRPVAGPPGIPEDRIAFLRDAFDKAMNDPEFVEKMTSADRELSFVDGMAMGEIARASTDLSPEVKEVIVSAIRGEL